MTDKILGQEEIDALLRTDAADETTEADPEPTEAGGPEILTEAEKDALGEIGNICMGSAATTLSAILGHKVSITSPKVNSILREDLLARFTVPYLVIEVKLTEGLSGAILLVVQVKDAAVIANLMMGNDGTAPPEALGEMEVSAAAEAMNQMIGSSATALATLVGRTITISPPNARVFESPETSAEAFKDFERVLVVIAFSMQVGELVDTELLQIMTVDTAREEAALLWQGLAAEAPSPPVSETEPSVQSEYQEAEPEPEPQPAPAPGTPASLIWPEAPDGPATPPEPDWEKMSLVLDLPLKITVILGRSRRPIKEVLGLAPGSVLELATLADEPVEVLVNGALVAWGEVVVVNDNFGVRITSIISPRERIQNLRQGGNGHLSTL